MKVKEVEVNTLSCPFCGHQPKIMRGKLTGCQLHGEPMQPIVVRCDNRNCVTQPSIKPYGDLYSSRGVDTVVKEAVDIWNNSFHRVNKTRVVKF